MVLSKVQNLFLVMIREETPPACGPMCCPNNFQGTNNLDHKMNNSRGEQRYVAQFTTGNIVRFVWWSHDLARM